MKIVLTQKWKRYKNYILNVNVKCVDRIISNAIVNLKRRIITNVDFSFNENSTFKRTRIVQQKKQMTQRRDRSKQIDNYVEIIVWDFVCHITKYNNEIEILIRYKKFSLCTQQCSNRNLNQRYFKWRKLNIDVSILKKFICLFV